jgi:hypothetical protein
MYSIQPVGITYIGIRYLLQNVKTHYGEGTVPDEEHRDCFVVIVNSVMWAGVGKG